MYEVKVVIVDGNVHRTVTIATFEDDTAARAAVRQARSRAISFAKQIDPEFEVSVVNTEDEDNREKAFGLVWAHVPGDSSRLWDGVKNVPPDAQW
jgi:hypothetical protein